MLRKMVGSNALLKDLVTVDPYPFQKKGVEFGLLHHYCLIGDEMGLGKTLQALIIAFIMISRGKKVLIVVPSFLRINWFFEIDKFAKRFYEISLVESFQELSEWGPGTLDITIMSYSMSSEAERVFEWADMVIADEAHYLKSIEAQRTVGFHKHIYEHMPERLILLTGTPLPNGTVEFYSLLRLLGYTPQVTNGKNVFIDYEIPEPFYKDFANEVTVRVGGRTYIKYTGLKNKELLKSYLRGKYIRRKCKDVLDLPPLLEKDIIVAYGDNPKLMREFNEFNLDDTYSSKAKAKSALLKAPFTVEYAQNLFESGRGPILVFTDHVAACKYIAKELECPFIFGEVSQKKRAKYIKQFQNGELDYLVLTTGSGAEGNNLHRARHIVVNDPNWVPAKNEQLRKRIHRIGQDFTCYIHNILGSIQDRKILRTLRSKMKVIGEII